MDNDVNCCALAEGHWGAAAGHGDFVWMQISTGVGGGLVSGGRIFRGAHGQAGEIGHIQIRRHGVRCACGRRGCLETCVSGPAILRRYRESGAEAARTEDVFAAAREGDRRAQQLLRGVADDLALAVDHVVNVVDPALVVLGGGVMAGFGPDLALVTASVASRARRSGTTPPPVVPTALGGDAALLGAAALLWGSTEPGSAGGR
jgi:glucokinase